MPKVRLFLCNSDEKIWEFKCPGCGKMHQFWERWNGGKAAWKFNGDAEKPTVTPSILTWRSGQNCRCHSFISEGRIRFLPDSEHILVGKTVDLPDLDN